MSIPKQMINGFIKSELELFKQHFDDSPVPEIQDERSIAIAWLCYYFKDSVTSENSSAIIQFVDHVAAMENYTHHGWFRISALQAAAFILTSDIYYANSLIQHVDCGQSTARRFIIECASIICPLLSFDNQQLKKATEKNIDYAHGLFEESSVLYLSTDGTAKEKSRWLDNQISLSETDSRSEILLSLKTAGRFYKSGFFSSAFNRAKSYVIFKMFSRPVLADIQLQLFDNTEIHFAELTTLEKKHPLHDYYIDMSFSANEE